MLHGPGSNFVGVYVAPTSLSHFKQKFSPKKKPFWIHVQKFVGSLFTSPYTIVEFIRWILVLVKLKENVTKKLKK
jgi:hypothetical protein